jgi:hypothetical protein
MRAFHLLAVLAAIALATASAQACIFNAPPVERISRVRADAVVLGTVIEASYTDRTRHGSRPWSGTVQAKRVVRGKTKTARFTISRSGDSAACDDGIKAPASGELWVVYLRKEAGKETVVLAYPLSVARQADPSLAAVLEGN